MDDKNSPHTLETTQRSLEIIEAIQALDGATMAELVDRLGLVKSTVYKHLQTLRANGYLEKEGERYHVGLKFYNLGGYARSRKQEHQLAIETTRTLTEETREEVDLVVENDGRGLVLHESYHIAHQYAASNGGGGEEPYHLGTYYNLHCTGAGKALLADMPDERVREIIDQWGLPPRTQHTITSEATLFDELDQIRDRGYAFSNEEAVEGLRAVGQSVEGADGRPVCAISIFGPAYRMTEDRFRDEIPQTLAAAVEALEEKIKTQTPTIDR
ncbi:IclR family transcriptional regulator [Halobellus ordinarius]|uniref:IclR family transcriptional regulator n=1 Tax=Halobellus ordinarius TaxID=3075120 RepID=UPI00287FF953|nr:IclR family transcriptional regulator [Halobellus sp. ZY16]